MLHNLQTAETETGLKMYERMKDLFPICRSLSGEGVRETLRYFQNILPQMTIHSVPSGTQVFDWTVPDEWNVRDAFIADETGKRVIDFQANNLHLLGYSEPIDTRMSFAELDKNLYSLPEQPSAIPYITSYYKRRWGFCLTENQRNELRKNPEAQYHVKIDSILEPGVLNYGELIIPGATDKEIMFSTYICHPSMANNELSGPCVASALAEFIRDELPDCRYTYRILFLVETIGSIIYLSKNLETLKKNLAAGFVLTCVGDDRAYSYVASRYGDTVADKAVKHILKYHAPDYISYDFLARGSDERQYCSPGVDLPVCSVCRSKYGEYPEYHTSLDDLSLVTPSGLQGAFDVYKKVIILLEHNAYYRCVVPCEPQLGKRGLYPTVSTKDTKNIVANMMNLIAYADGKNDLIDIADRVGVNALDLLGVLKQMLDNQLFVIEDS